VGLLLAVADSTFPYMTCATYFGKCSAVWSYLFHGALDRRLSCFPPKPTVSSEQVDRDTDRSLISLSSFTDPIITRGGGRLYITKLANARAWRMETGRLAIVRDLISAPVRFGDALFLEDFTRPNSMRYTEYSANSNEN
jgi:hypothetical protein